MPELLRAAGFTVHAMFDVHGKRKSQNLSDTVWIPHAAGNGWAIFSKDNGLKTDPEFRTIEESRAIVFLIPDANSTAVQQAARYVANKHRIAMKHRKGGPSLYIVRPNSLDLFARTV